MAGRLIAGLLVPEFNSWSGNRKLNLIEKIDHPVRKAAHATEYAVLGGLLFATMQYYVIQWQEILPWLKGSLYAVSDELHQFFVPGRSCRMSDLLLDSMGVLVGVWMSCFLIKNFLRKQRRR